MFFNLVRFISAVSLVFQLTACGGGGSSQPVTFPPVSDTLPVVSSPQPVNNTPPGVPNPPANTAFTVPCGSGTFAPAGYTSESQCKVGITVLPKNIQMLTLSELRIKFSDVDGNDRTKTFTYSNGQTGTALLSAVNGSISEEIIGSRITLEGPSGKQTVTATLRDTGVIAVSLPNTFHLSYATSYTVSLSGFSAFWSGDAIMVAALQTVSFKTPDNAFVPPQTCGTQSNEPCLLTALRCTWSNPCILGAAKQDYFLENPANPTTYGLLENNYLGTASSSNELVFKSSGIKVGPGYGVGFFRYSYNGNRVEKVRYSSRGDAYFEFSTQNSDPGRCWRVGWNYFGTWDLDTAYLNGTCDAFGLPNSNWLIPLGKRIDRLCTLVNKCTITNDAHYVDDPAINDTVNGKGFIFSRSFNISGFINAFAYRRYWLDIGPEPLPSTFVPNDPQTMAANKLTRSKNAFWVTNDLYVETDSGSCFHVNKLTFTACPY